jgi:hypothetical protein
MKKKLLALLFSLATLTLVACGGDGTGSSSNSTAATPVANYATLPTPAGVPCLDSTAESSHDKANGWGATVNASNTDAFGNINFVVGGTDYGTAKPYNCMVVDQANNQPVYSGTQSVRFENRVGDCFIGRGPYDDCANDRQHNDLQSWTWSKSYNTSQGQIITYEHAVYIPSQPMIQPPPTQVNGLAPFTVLAQVKWTCSSINPCTNADTNGTGTLIYLVIDYKSNLHITTLKDFTWNTNQMVTIDTNPYNKWIKFKYVIKSTANADGYIQVYANDKLVVNETRATLPNTNAMDYLKVGIYNSFLSSSTQWQTQVVYFDGFSTLVQNFK